MTEGYHFFWSGPLSQWQRSEFLLDGVTFGTAEQAMMHAKAILFGDKDTAQRILQADDPGRQKALGRTVKDFDEAIWKQHREDIVYRINYAKFDQNKGLRRSLFQTSGLHLAEASPVDIIWGIGLSADAARNTPPGAWPGLNLLGKILTEVRDDLMQAHPEHARAVVKEP